MLSLSVCFIKYENSLVLYNCEISSDWTKSWLGQCWVVVKVKYEVEVDIPGSCCGRLSQGRVWLDLCWVPGWRGEGWWVSLQAGQHCGRGWPPAERGLSSAPGPGLLHSEAARALGSVGPAGLENSLQSHLWWQGGLRCPASPACPVSRDVSPVMRGLPGTGERSRWLPRLGGDDTRLGERAEWGLVPGGGAVPGRGGVGHSAGVQGTLRLGQTVDIFLLPVLGSL